MILAALLLGSMLLLVVLPGWLAGPLSWLLVAYVVVRAWPAMRADVRGFRGVSPLRARRSRGVHL